MRTITAREANQQFSKLLEAAAGGEEVTITRRGVPIARLVPVLSPEAQAERQRKREAALDWLMRNPLRGGVVVDWTRDELYERD